MFPPEGTTLWKGPGQHSSGVRIQRVMVAGTLRTKAFGSNFSHSRFGTRRIPIRDPTPLNKCVSFVHRNSIGEMKRHS